MCSTQLKRYSGKTEHSAKRYPGGLRRLKQKRLFLFAARVEPAQTLPEHLLATSTVLDYIHRPPSTTSRIHVAFEPKIGLKRHQTEITLQLTASNTRDCESRGSSQLPRQTSLENMIQ